ncbi:hypothetical protein D0861_06641 [Hortaea werneckii]|uniref:Uncharacterized protein n=1 Tax=Hortaea werneckii TaxID=91943 RepID=A0A3M7F838_HORWE|nr:hypothetical protein D0861_06641 [Hortaea werneckii]
MADCGFLPLPVCIQCGTNQNPCHIKIVGPTLGFIVGVCMAIICWPAALLCCCCATDAGKRYVLPTGSATRVASKLVQDENV